LAKVFTAAPSSLPCLTMEFLKTSPESPLSSAGKHQKGFPLSSTYCICAAWPAAAYFTTKLTTMASLWVLVYFSGVISNTVISCVSIFPLNTLSPAKGAENWMRIFQSLVCVVSALISKEAPSFHEVQASRMPAQSPAPALCAVEN